MIRRLLPLKFGRLTPRQATAFGEMLGSFGYIGIGPFLLIVNLPKRLQVADPVVSLFDLNAHLRAVFAEQGKPIPEWLAALPSTD